MGSSKSQPMQKEITFGSRVELTDGNGWLLTVELVPSYAVNLEAQQISVESPLGRVLKGKRAGEKVRVLTPVGEQEFEVLTVR